ncbi:MAG: PHP domain-containing protein [bacterium]
MIRGLFHIHTSFSYDSSMSIEELKDFCERKGYRFVAITEHREGMNPTRMNEFVEKCQMVSDSSFLCIPGLEFSCKGNIHILGLGIKEYFDGDNPKEIVECIHIKEGLAILAHPGRKEYELPKDLLSTLDGIEIWNEMYDGRFIPKIDILSLFERAKRINPNLLAFSGVELHSLSQSVTLSLIMNDDKNILKALKKGDFRIIGGLLSFSSSPRFRMYEKAWFCLVRCLYDIARKIKRRVSVAVV